MLPFHSQGRDLFGNQTEHKDNDGRSPHENRHIREPAVGQKSVKIIRQTGEEKEKTHRKKHTERRKQSRNFRNDQQKPNTVRNQTDFTLTGPVKRLDRKVLNRQTGPQKSQRQRRRIRKSVGQQIDEAQRVEPFKNAKTGSEIFDGKLRNVRGQKVVNQVGNVAVKAQSGTLDRAPPPYGSFPLPSEV